MPTVEMLVYLKVSDNVAITAFNTLKRMGYQIRNLERADYYKFDVKGNTNIFKKQIHNVDILVNPNKHKISFTIEKNNKKQKNSFYKKIKILIQDLDNENELLSTLKGRLGFKNIKKVEKGILWTMHFDKDADANNIALHITKNLLMNESYQKYKII